MVVNGRVVTVCGRVEGCGGRILRRGWSGGVSVLVDEAVASGRYEDSDPWWIGLVIERVRAGNSVVAS